MYRYEGTGTQLGRRARTPSQCYCASTGATYALRDLVSGGLVRLPNEADPLTTPDFPKAPTFTPTGAFIFAVSEEYELRVGADAGDRSQGGQLVKHETLFHNSDVRAAGEILIIAGIVSDLNDSSGSYGTRGKMETDPEFARAVLRALRNARVEVVEGLHARLQLLSGAR